MTSTTFARIDAALRDADSALITAALAFRQSELNGTDVDSAAWLSRIAKLRDAADRVLAVTRAMSSDLGTQRLLADVPEVYDLPCGHRAEEACEACVPDEPVDLRRTLPSIVTPLVDMPSLVAMAARHYPAQCVSNASCTCACDTCMAEHNPEGA
jgi:hypothetical protein